MKKIISFSLWGSNPKYTYGAIENARLAKTIYPGWIARFYCGTDVHPSIISALKDEEAEVIIVNEANDNRGMFWRFYAASDKDCSFVIFRDTDSRLTIREAEAVEQWVQSSRAGHIMRDHPYHDMPIMGGMWGCRGDIFPDMYHIFRGHRMRNTIKRRLFPGIAAEVSSSADRFDFHSFDRAHNIRWKANDLRHRCGADPCRIADIHTYVRFHPHIMQRQAAANTAYGIQ